MAENDRPVKPDLIERLKSIDRRIIFLFIAAAVIFPLLRPIGFPVKASPPAIALYNAVERLRPGSLVLMAFDYDPSTMAELYPMSLAILRHCFSRRLKVVALALWPMGAGLAREALHDIGVGEFGLRYGTDFVNLGFKAGGIVVIETLGSSIAEAFPADIDGTPVERLSLMRRARKLEDFDLVIDLSAGDPGIPFWVMIAQGRYGRKVGGGCTAVSAPQFYPYFQSGQLVGLLGGMKGAAEYELLANAKGEATKGMDAQSVSHAAIVFFVIVGNVFYFLSRHRSKRRG